MIDASRGRRGSIFGESRAITTRFLSGAFRVLAAASIAVLFGVAARDAHAGLGPNLVGNPSFETTTTGWIAYSGSTIARVSGGADGAFALEMHGPATTATFGVNDSPNWINTVLSVGTRYRFSAKVRSDAAVGVARLQVREYEGGVQHGVTTKSPGVTLSPSWQTITVDYVATTAGSNVDFQIIDTPVASGETFRTDDVSIRVVYPDQPPVVSAPATRIGSEGAVLTLHVTASDPDGEPITSLTASLIDLPGDADAVFVADPGQASGTLTWTPGYDHAGSYPVSFTATNALVGTATTTLIVDDVDREPIATSPASITTAEETTVVVQVTAADPDGNPIASLVADLSDLPVGHDAVFVADPGNTSGTLTWRPTLADGGRGYTVRFFAANALNGPAAATSIVVTQVDQAPVVTAPASVAARENEPISVHAGVVDPDGDAIGSLIADLSGLPEGSNAVFSADPGNASGTLTWTPSFEDSGTHRVTFVAGNALSDTSSTVLLVVNVDRAPNIVVPAAVVASENAPVSVEVTASDPDGEAVHSLDADLSGLPAGATAVFTPAAGNSSGTLTWSPGYEDAGGPYVVTFTAANALSGVASTALEVSNVDRPPVIIVPQSVGGRDSASIAIEVSAFDPDGDPVETLTVDLSELPAGNDAAFVTTNDHTSGTLTWTPRLAGSGSFSVSFTAANAQRVAASATLSVAGIEHPPFVLVPPTASAEEGSLFSVTVTAGDPDHDAIDALTADLSGLPLGSDAAFTPADDNTSGTLTWWVDFDAAREEPYIVTFTAANRESGSGTLAITVSNVDGAPVVTAPASVTGAENARVTLEVTAVDPDGDAIADLSADLSGLPDGADASFTPAADNASGTLTWTPSFVDGRPQHYLVTFTAANARIGSLTSEITVLNVDRPPVVSGPASVSGDESSLISFEVTAADPDGEAITTLSADLSTLPAGADAVFTPSADHTSGTLRWTPDFEHAGSYDITFTAANAHSGSTLTITEVIDVDRAPMVLVPPTVEVHEGLVATIDVLVEDPDGDAIASLEADLSGLPEGNDAVFTSHEGNASGTLTWTTLAGDLGGPYPVSFTATNVMSSSNTTAVLVLSPNQPPVARLAVTPSPTSGPSLVTASAAASTDPDGSIASYLFDFGDGTVIGPQESPTASATLTGGVQPVTVIVTDLHGATGTATVTVQANLGNRCVNPSFENTTMGWVVYGGSAVARVSGVGRTGNYAFQVSKAAGGPAWGLNDSPDWVPVTVGPGNTYRFIAWVRSLTSTGKAYLRVQEFLGTVQKGLTRLSPAVTLTETWQPVSVDYTVTTAGTRLDMKILYDAVGANEKFLIDDVQVLLLPRGDQAPVVMAPAAVTAIAGQPFEMRMRASDPDGQPITSLDASLAALPPGHDASFTPDPDLHGGTLTWTPSAADVGPIPYRVTFTAANGLFTTMPMEIAVAGAPLPNLCVNGGFETNASGWSPYGAGATITRVNSGRTGSFAIQLANSTGTGWGVNDQLDIVTATAGVGRTYRYSAWVRSATSAGKVKLRLQEFLGSVQKGVTVESPEVTLGPTWQRLVASTVASTAGTRLDMKIVNAPVAAGESFLVDDVEVVLMPPGDRPPVMAAPAALTVPRDQPMTVSVTVSDPDGDAISSLVADLSGLPAGHNASFTPSPDGTSGILSWTPAAAAVRAAPYTVTFRASNTKTALASTAITVVATTPGNLCLNPGFETNLAGWGTYGAVTLARVAGGHSGSFALQMTSAGMSSFGSDDTPNWVATVAGAGAQYRFTAWVRSASSTSPVRLRIYEFLSGVQQGAVVYSQEVPVAGTWQQLTVDYMALSAGSTLSMRVTMSPTSANQSFLVDDVSIQHVTGGAALVALAAGDDAAVEPGRRLLTDDARLDPDGAGAWTVRIEGVEPFLEDGLPEVALRFGEREAAAHPEHITLGDDHDGNGREELAVAFERRALQELFGTLGPEVEHVNAAVVVRRGRDEVVEIPLEIELAGNGLAFTSSFAPNPMRAAGILSFALTRPGPVRVELYDPAGRRVRSLMNEPLARAGRHQLEVRAHGGGARLSSGVYFYRIMAGEGVRAGRLIVLE